MNPLINTLQHDGDSSPGELRDRIRMLESALESMGDGVVVVNQEGRFLLCNSAARRIYGRDPVEGSIERWAELYGVFLPDRVTPFPANELPLARALRGESADQTELFFRNQAHPEGIYVESTARPLRDPDHAIRGGIVVLRDISAHKQAEVELRDSNHRLSQLVAEQARRVQQSRLLAEMSSLLQATTGVDELYAVVADYLERLFPEAQGAFFAYSASRDDLERMAVWGTYASLDESPLIKPPNAGDSAGDGPTAWTRPARACGAHTSSPPSMAASVPPCSVPTKRLACCTCASRIGRSSACHRRGTSANSLR